MSQPVPEKPFYHRITKNAFYLLVGNGVTNVAAFGSNVILGRILGLNGYATIAFLIGLVSVCEKVFDFGLSKATTKRVAEELNKPKSEQTSETIIHGFLRSFLFHGLAGLIFTVTLIVMVPFKPLAGFSKILTALVGVWVLIPIITKSYSSIYNGFEEMRFTMMNYFIQEPLKMVLLVTIVLMNTATLEFLIPMWTIIYIGTGVMVIILGRNFLFKKFNRKIRGTYSIQVFLDLFKDSIVYFLPFIGVTVTPGMVLIILGVVSSKSEIGWFAASASLSSMIYLVLLPVSGALLPAFTNRFVKTGEALEPGEGARLLRLVAFFNMISLLGFLALGNWMIQMTFGLDFIPAFPVLIVLVAANFFESFRLCTDPMLNSVNAANIVTRIELIRFGIMIPLVIFLGFQHGGLGAAIGVLSAGILSQLFRLYAIHSRLFVKQLVLVFQSLIWVGSVLLAWQLNVPIVYLAPLAFLFGFSIRLVHGSDIRVLFYLISKIIPKIG